MGKNQNVFGGAKRLAKRVIIGTALEFPLRSIADTVRDRVPMGSDDRMTLEIMRRATSLESCCIDVGAHKGVFLRNMTRLAPNGRHFGFEPIPWLFERLTRAFRPYPNVIIFSFALSDENGASRFHYNQDNPAFSGILRRRYPRDDDRVFLLDVELRRLDDVVPNDMQVDFIKVDVEGAELAVFRGAAALIKRCRPVIVFEFGTGSSEFYGSSPEALYDFYSALDYQVHTLADHLAGAAPLDKERLIEEYRTNNVYYFVASAVG